MKPKILLFSGSTRDGSLNQKLVNSVAANVESEGGYANIVSLTDYSLPIYNADFELENGIPENAQNLHETLVQHQGVFIACPEYNGGYTALLKNTIDWLSRIRVEGQASVFKDRIFVLGAAAPGKFGGIRGLLNIRPVLEVALGATVMPDQILLSNAKDAFNSNGELIDSIAVKRSKQIAALLVSESGRFSDMTN